MLRRAAIFLLGLAPALGCSTYNEVTMCHVGADCASGICNADGTCVPESTTTASTGTGGHGGTGGAGGSGGTGGATTSSSTSSSSTGGGGMGGGATCSPNKDGTITRQEVPLQAGLHATFRVADNATFDTAGTSQADGSRTWDLKVSFSGDHALLVDTAAVDPNAWYAADFPGATYQSRLSDTSDLLGIFKLTSDSLLLLGVASPVDGPSATELIYATPIVVLAFPLTQGKTWDTLSAVSGKAQGIPIGGIYNEEYTSTVDAHGTLKTPFADLPVLRVHTKLLRYINGVWMTRQTHSFVAECFGSVGTIQSQDNELATDFTSAAEIWRLSP